MPIDLFLPFHDHSMDYLHGFRNLIFATSLDDYYIGDFMTVFMFGILFFSLFFDGDCKLRHWEHLFIYIKAWLLIQGVQFSSDC